MKKKTSNIIFLFLLCLPSYAQLNEFMISSYFYFNIPSGTTEERFFRKLKNEYNFNAVLMASQDEALDTTQLVVYKHAKEAGLKAIGYTNNLYSRKLEFDKTAAISDMQTLSGIEYDVIGYHVIDEPDAKTSYWPNGVGEDTPSADYNYIDNIPQYTKTIRDYDPSLLRFANLLSRAVFPEIDYREEYIQKYIDEADANLISFDHYPIADGNDRFFVGLYDVAIKSAENKIPFIYVMTPFRSKSDIMLSEIPSHTVYGKNIAEFRYVIYASLAYGAKGINYWSGFEWVCSHYSKFFPLSLEDNVLKELSELHEKLIAHSDELLSLNFINAYHVSNEPTIQFAEIIKDRKEQIYDCNEWKNFAKDEYAMKIFGEKKYSVYEKKGIRKRLPQELVVTFLKNDSGQIYFWLFNKSLKRDISLVVKTQMEYKDVLNGEIVTNNRIQLAPGEGILFTVIDDFSFRE